MSSCCCVKVDGPFLWGWLVSALATLNPFQRSVTSWEPVPANFLFEHLLSPLGIAHPELVSKRSTSKQPKDTQAWWGSLRRAEIAQQSLCFSCSASRNNELLKCRDRAEILVKAISITQYGKLNQSHVNWVTWNQDRAKTVRKSSCWNVMTFPQGHGIAPSCKSGAG